jgi:hypothetical protein
MTEKEYLKRDQGWWKIRQSLPTGEHMEKKGRG